MTPRRRTVRGTALLLGAAGAVVTISSAGCHSPPSTLMAAPFVEICVAATPPEALVTLDGQPLDTTRCASVRKGSTVTIEATLAGYAPYREDHEAREGGQHAIVLTPEHGTEATPPE